MTDEPPFKASINVIEFINGQPKTSSWNEFLTHRNDTTRLFKVDLTVQDTATLNTLIDAIHQNPLVIERCLDSDSVSGVHIYNNMLTIQIPVVDNWEASNHPKLTILCLANALLTVRTVIPTENPDAVPELMPLANQPFGLEQLLFAVLDNIIDRASELTLSARHTVDLLETEMQGPTDEKQIGRRILFLKRAAGHFEMALEAKHRTLMALLSVDTELINLHSIREPLHDVVAHVEHSLRYIERVEDHLSELDRHFLLLLQNRTNNRLRILTIISAIFMPLTLIAGIYGMNFHIMPELSWHYGYAIVLLLMSSIALGLIWYFYHKGWFR